jgi:transcriptional regulator with XRE-family HTH domain
VQIPRLREWRELRGWTQKDLAHESGVSARSIAGYETGASVRPRTARKLAEALDVEVAELVMSPKGSAPPSQPSFNHLLAEERRSALIERFVERWSQHIEGRAAYYEMQMAAAEHGGIFAGHEGAKVLFEEAWADFLHLLGLTNGEMAERWLEDPEVPEDVKTELGFALQESFNRLGRTIVRISEREAALAETEAQRQEAERRREQIRERTRKIGA